MSGGLRFLPAAVEEFHHAIAWYETQRPGLGKIFVDSIDDALASIESDPARFAIIYREVRMSLVKDFPTRFIFVKRVGKSKLSAYSMLPEIQVSGSSEPDARILWLQSRSRL